MILRFPVNITAALSLALYALPLRADDGSTSALWPWFSLFLTLLLSATIFFCFWLQKQITRLQHRLRDQQISHTEMQKRLEDVLNEDQFRTTFFHNSSHELRTPLNGIIGFLQLTIQGQYGTLPPAVRVQVNKCVMLAESLKHQITTILDIADGRRGKLQLQNSRIQLSQLMIEIETIAESLRLRYPDCQFDSKKNWVNDDGVFIHDNGKVLMILRNLVSNAFKFSKPQQRNHVTLAISKRGRSLTIEVSDQGVGLSSEQISRLFDDNSTQVEGRGLGIAMVRLLLKLMQGEMKIASEPGTGSKFTIVIPEQSAVHLENSSTEYMPLASQGSVDDESFATTRSLQPSHNLMKMEGHATHILVVDDNEINCEIIQEILIPQGYRVSLAYGGREALTRMRGDRPDLVLLDLAMPEFSGENVMQEKQLDSSLTDIPVILITARASEEDRIHGLDLGADDYLTKPIIQQELVLRVRNLLSRQRLTKRLALMEEREKLAQLGELITDLSREVKEIYADRLALEAGRALCQIAIEALPHIEKFGPSFAHVYMEEQVIGEEITLDALPLPKRDPESLNPLRAMRLQLAPSRLQPSEKIHIWQAMQELSSADLKLFHRVTSLAATHIDLMEQMHKSKLLMDGILEFHQRRGAKRICRLDQAMSKTVNLLGPRLRMAGVRMTAEMPQMTLAIHPADLMQVCISLITTMCHRLEMLLDQDKWLNVEARSLDDHLLLRFTCGGPQLTENQALRLFDPVSESQESGPLNNGLHVARRIVQRTPGRLDFSLNETTTCFELELPMALTGTY